MTNFVGSNILLEDFLNIIIIVSSYVVHYCIHALKKFADFANVIVNLVVISWLSLLCFQ